VACPLYTGSKSNLVTKTVFHKDPEILNGTAVFCDTRVPIRILFEHLEAGDSLEVFLEDFPSVSREQATGLLEHALQQLTSNNEVAA